MSTPNSHISQCPCPVTGMCEPHKREFVCGSRLLLLPEELTWCISHFKRLLNYRAVSGHPNKCVWVISSSVLIVLFLLITKKYMELDWMWYLHSTRIIKLVLMGSNMCSKFSCVSRAGLWHRRIPCCFREWTRWSSDVYGYRGANRAHQWLNITRKFGGFMKKYLGCNSDFPKDRVAAGMFWC